MSDDLSPTESPFQNSTMYIGSSAPCAAASRFTSLAWGSRSCIPCVIANADTRRSVNLLTMSATAASTLLHDKRCPALPASPP